MSKRHTVYQVIKSYCNYDDQWEGVRGEYDSHQEALEHYRFKQENPDTNAMYYVKTVERDFPACKACQGSGRISKKSMSTPCVCAEQRRRNERS